MPGPRDLKRRIKSIQSTRKITRAMQMVSAAKMRKAQNAVLATRSYSQLAGELIANIAKDETMNRALDLPLLKSHPNAQKVGIIVLSSNRGLVGSLNSNLLPKVRELFPTQTAAEADGGIIAKVTTYGKKARTIVQRLKATVIADFEKKDKTLSAEDVYPLVKHVVDMYMTGGYRKIVVVYNHFVSTLSQKPTIRQLLPFSDKILHPHQAESPAEREQSDKLDIESEYLFEPAPKQVLEHLLPRIIESQIYQSILESEASEYSARMVMMKNATEAAGDLISDLTLMYNQLRQNKITTELAEITAGKIALE